MGERGFPSHGKGVRNRAGRAKTAFGAGGIFEAGLFTKFKNHYSPSNAYKEYKRTYVASRNVGAAEGKTIELRSIGYGLVGNNCLDHVYAVLEAYGTQKDDVMQWKQTHAAPNSWFRAFGNMDLSGKITKVDNQPGAAISTN